MTPVSDAAARAVPVPNVALIDALPTELSRAVISSAPKTMTAAILRGKEDVRIERIPVAALKPGEIRVQIGAALTCGTDVKVFRRGYHARMIQPPAVFGHEFAGTITEVGENVAAWRVGQRVTSANSAPCGECYYCRRDLTELCDDLQFLNGAYAESIVIPARFVSRSLYEIPASLSFAEAALTEPLACVVHGMEAVPIRSGETVVVLGTGPIGLMFVRLCHLAGARVIAAGRRRERLNLASRLGADEVFDVNKTPNLIDVLKARTDDGRGADKVIEAVGTPDAWQTAIALGRKAATISLFGGCPKDSLVTLDTHRIHYDELTLVGAFHHTPRTFRAALDLICRQAVPARDFLTETAPLSELPAVLAALARGKNRAVKIAIDTGG